MIRKNKHIYVILVILVLFGVSIGYAAISRVLTINGNSEVKQNTWDLHFENIKVTNGSVEADDPTIDNTNLAVNFNFFLNLPGDFYEFTVDVVNSGTIDAMIDSITKTPTLTTDQAKYLNYIIEYQNGEQITSKQLVKNREFVRIKVRVEYREDISEEDMPTTNQSLDLGFTLNYIQADSTGIIVTNNGAKVEPTANGLLEDIGTIVTIGTEQFYTIGIEGDNVKLLSMYNLYVGYECTSTFTASCTPYGSEATGMQDSTMLGSNIQLLTNTSLRTGVTVFSSDTQKGTNYSDYNGSIVEGYVNNYKIAIETMGLDVVEARLVNLDELDDTLGCRDPRVYTKACQKSPYEWVYSTCYWVGAAENDEEIWRISNSNTMTVRYDNDVTAGVRPVIVIPRSDIVVKVKPTADGSLDDIGTIVTIGTEQFYTIGTEGNNVKLLSMLNITLDDNLKQSSSSSTTAFSNVGTSYDGSLVESYANAYGNKLRDSMGLNVVESRLITANELISQEIGCSDDERTCIDTPYSWIYSTTYWTGSATNDSYVWTVNSSGHFRSDTYDNISAYGVRPVIIISKSLF